MVTQSWLYDAIIYIYALSLLFYFSDFMEKNKKSTRLGAWLLALVWLLQSLVFALGLIGRGPALFSMFDVLLFFSWGLVTLSLILNWFLRIDFLIFFVNLIGFTIVAFNYFSDETATSALGDWNIQSDLLFIHVSLALVSYVTFILSAVFSGMYLFLHRRLKDRKWSRKVARFPSLETIERGAYIAAVVGTPLLLLSMLLGLDWVILQGDPSLVFDPKVLNSMLVLAAYGFYLLQRHYLKATGQRLAWWNLAAFAFIVLNYGVSNFISNFHQWIGK